MSPSTFRITILRRHFFIANSGRHFHCNLPSPFLHCNFLLGFPCSLSRCRLTLPLLHRPSYRSFTLPLAVAHYCCHLSSLFFLPLLFVTPSPPFPLSISCLHFSPPLPVSISCRLFVSPVSHHQFSLSSSVVKFCDHFSLPFLVPTSSSPFLVALYSSHFSLPFPFAIFSRHFPSSFLYCHLRHRFRWHCLWGLFPRILFVAVFSLQFWLFSLLLISDFLCSFVVFICSRILESSPPSIAFRISFLSLPN